MFNKRYAHPGTAPATLATLPQTTPGETIIRVVVYNAQGLEERDIQDASELPEISDDGRVYWIEVNGLGNLGMLKALGEKYNLHPLALEDVIHTGQRPKMEPYDEHLFMVAQMIYRDAEERLVGEQVSMFLCKNLLVTIQEESQTDPFDPIRERIRVGRGYIRKLGPDYLAYALLDAIIDHCFPILEELGEAMEVLENRLMEEPTQACVHELHGHRRTLMQLRRFVWPERDLLNTLLHDESGMVGAQTKIFVRDCYDHTIQIMDLVESYRDVSAGLLEMYLSSVSLKTNEIMRVLTVISSIFIPLTFVAGVYGMNFSPSAPTDNRYPWNMPELYSPWGYPMCLLVMGAIAIGQVLFFRRKKWL